MGVVGECFGRCLRDDRSIDEQIGMLGEILDAGMIDCG